jgi:hypothetical protein
MQLNRVVRKSEQATIARRIHYYLLLAKNLGYGDNKALLLPIEEIGKMLTAYIKALKIES